MSPHRNLRLVRQLQLMRALAASSGLSLNDCVKALDGRVTDRTVRRDLEALGEVFTLLRRRREGDVVYRLNPKDLLSDLGDAR